MFFKSLLRYKWYALSSLLMTSLMIASSLLLPWFLKHILDALQEQNSQTIYSMGGWLIGIGFVGLVAGGINVTLAAYIAQAVSSDLREETFRKIQTFSYANIEEFNAGNLVVRMTNDINQILNVTMMLFQILLRLPILFIGSVILAIVTMPSLWWIIFLLIVLIAGLTAVMMGMMGPRFKKFQTLLDKINAIAKENLRGVRVVKSFVREEDQFHKFSQVSDELLSENLYIGYAFSIIEPMMMLVGYSSVYLAIWTLSGMIQAEPGLVSSIASFIGYLSQIIFTIIMVGFLGNGVTRGIISIRRIKEILATEPAMTFPDSPDEELEGSLSFEHVTFSYPNDDEPMLKDISFEVEPGQMIGVVGATGAGKSTLAQLIPRLLIRKKALSRLAAGICESLVRELFVKMFLSCCSGRFYLAGPLRKISVRASSTLHCLKWSERLVLPKPVNLSAVWKKVLTVQWRNVAATSLAVRSSGCPLLEVLSTILIF